MRSGAGKENKGLGTEMNDEEIRLYASKLGYRLINPNNWTFSTERIYLSDMHDENVIRSKNGNIFVIDCDIRINTPEMNAGGIRELTNYVEFLN